jgi:hypothetical protein
MDGGRQWAEPGGVSAVPTALSTSRRASLRRQIFQRARPALKILSAIGNESEPYLRTTANPGDLVLRAVESNTLFDLAAALVLSGEPTEPAGGRRRRTTGASKARSAGVSTTASTGSRMSAAASRRVS